MQSGNVELNVLETMAEDDKQEDVDSNLQVPRVGLEFGTVDELYEYCLAYARRTGYPVRKKSQKKRYGVLTYVSVCCARGGKNKPKESKPVLPQLSSKSGCNAKVSAKLNGSGKWEITIVNLEHNHILSPGRVRHYRCNRKINARVARQLDTCGHENTPSEERGCRGMRVLRLSEGDKAAIQQYFLTMQIKTNGFVYSMDFDDECRLRNIFWADRRCREAYKEFGDVVTFDTTYLTKNYDLPFVPFVGINHHGQSILFGCGLLFNEDMEAFIWLFRTWLSCMDDRYPTGIITDQDTTMQKAIEVVFPNTKHRWCLWNVMKKVTEKLRKHNQFDLISSTLQGIVYDTLSPEEFEYKWGHMINEYSLEEDNWLDNLYKERKRWAPAFVKTYFSAGMSSTQRGEGNKAFLDGYVNSRTTLKGFVEQYCVALRDKVEKEAKEDFRSYNLDMECVSPFEIEKQMRNIYTLYKFREFQKELIGKMVCDYVDVRELGPVFEYNISECKEFGDVVCRVLFDPIECEVKCSCFLFEFKGILCRHALMALCRNKVKVIPDKYILRRWRKDVRRSHTKIGVNTNTTPEQKRYDDLYLTFTELADLAVEDEKCTAHLQDWMEKYKLNVDSQDKMGSCLRTSKSKGEMC